MTSQQEADALLAQWWELWRLKPPERLRRIDEIADAAFDEELRVMESALNEPERMAA